MSGPNDKTPSTPAFVLAKPKGLTVFYSFRPNDWAQKLGKLGAGVNGFLFYFVRTPAEQALSANNQKDSRSL